MQRKIHNQTLFVAALSVYFGLLIVGAPPQVLARTEKHRFNCEKFKQIADTAFTGSDVQIFDFENFVGDLRNILFDPVTQKIELLKVNATVKVLDGSIESTIENYNLDSDSVKFFAFSAAQLSYNFPNDLQNKVSKFHWEVQTDKSTLFSSINFNQDSVGKSQSLGYALQTAQEFLKCQEPSDKQLALINKNTEISVQNDQVFIVTRLPRAGLDAFLKSDEKAN